MNEFRIVSSQELNKQFDDLCAQAKSERRGMFALGTAEAVRIFAGIRWKQANRFMF